MLNSQNKEIRGRILRIIERAGRHGVSDVLILDFLNDVHFHVSPGVLADFLGYLEEKGYIHMEDVEVEDEKRIIIKLTAKGKDLLEGNIPVDVGIKTKL